MLAYFYFKQLTQYFYPSLFFFYTSTQSESFWHLCLATPTWGEPVCRIALRHCQTSPVKSSPRNIPFRQRPSRAIPSLRSSQVGPEPGIAPIREVVRTTSGRRSGCEGPRLRVVRPLELSRWRGEAAVKVSLRVSDASPPNPGDKHKHVGCTGGPTVT